MMVSTTCLFTSCLGGKSVAARHYRRSHHDCPLNPQIIVFDVNKTLLNFDVLTPVFIRVSDDQKMLREWFNLVAVYSEALTLAGRYTDSGAVERRSPAHASRDQRSYRRAFRPDRAEAAFRCHADLSGRSGRFCKIKAGRLHADHAQQQSDHRRRGPKNATRGERDGG
jgi:hypothetical protein